MRGWRDDCEGCRRRAFELVSGRTQAQQDLRSRGRCASYRTHRIYLARARRNFLSLFVFFFFFSLFIPILARAHPSRVSEREERRNRREERLSNSAQVIVCALLFFLSLSLFPFSILSSFHDCDACVHLCVPLPVFNPRDSGINKRIDGWMDG